MKVGNRNFELEESRDLVEKLYRNHIIEACPDGCIYCYVEHSLEPDSKSNPNVSSECIVGRSLEQKGIVPGRLLGRLTNTREKP